MGPREQYIEKPCDRHQRWQRDTRRIRDGELRDDNAVWTYETPKADVAEIASYVAFYTNRVEITRGE